MKYLKHIVIYLLTALILSSALISCDQQSNSPAPSNTVGVDSPTDSLVVYGPPLNDDWLEPAIAEFSEKFPNVKVDYRSFTTGENNENFSEDIDNYFKITSAELAAGKGPDLVVGEAYLYNDIYKIMDAGAFCDLAPYIANDKDFEMSQYNEAVINGGIYKGKQLIMPLSYSLNSIITTDELLTENGISHDDLKSCDKLLKQISTYINKTKDTPGKTVFSNRGRQLTAYFPWSGVKYLDYENKKATIENDGFKMVMEAYKSLYQQDYVNQDMQSDGSYTADEAVSLIDKNTLFAELQFDPFNNFCQTYSALLHEQTPFLFSFPTVDNKVIAEVDSFAAIRNNSENKSNAYELLKVLLSSEAQASRYQYNIPVHKRSISTKLIDNMVGTGALDNSRIFFEKIPDHIYAEYAELLGNVDYCEFPSYGAMNVVWETMEPYFKDEASYEECLSTLSEKLELYLSE